MLLLSAANMRHHNHGNDHDQTGAWFWLGPEMIHLMVLPNPDPMNGRPEVQHNDSPCRAKQPPALYTLTAAAVTCCNGKQSTLMHAARWS